MLTKLTTRVQQTSEFERLLADSPQLREAFSASHSGLRLKLGFERGKSILVTSSRPQEGKSTVASCLAITAALAGQDILLVDGDLRRRAIESAVGIADSVGFGEVLVKEADPAEAIHSIELFDSKPTAGTLSVMSAGRNPPAFLPAIDWPAARAIFQSVARQFSMIILDSPPVLAASDALLFATLVDSVLLVIGSGSANRHELLRSKELLEGTGAPILGGILNYFDLKNAGPSHQPHSGYYAGSQTIKHGRREDASKARRRS